MAVLDDSTGVFRIFLFVCLFVYLFSCFFLQKLSSTKIREIELGFLNGTNMYQAAQTNGYSDVEISATSEVQLFKGLIGQTGTMINLRDYLSFERYPIKILKDHLKPVWLTIPEATN